MANLDSRGLTTQIHCSASGQRSCRHTCLPAAKRQMRHIIPVLDCSAGDAEKNAPKSVRTSAFSSSATLMSYPACPWPRETNAGFGAQRESQRQQGLLGVLGAFWQEMTREDDLPAEVQDVAYFSDGPGAGTKEEEPQGWARLWRHQGLKL